MAERFHPADLQGATVRWLLDLEWAGQTIRLSDAECDVETEDGEILHYAGVLDTIEVTEQMDLLVDASASSTSISVDAVLPVDVPLLVAQGHDLAAATGTLSKWIEGTLYEARKPILTGTVRDPEYGAADEAVSFSLEANAWDDSALIPSAGLRVDGTNWSGDMITSLAAEELGLVYPVVIGRPGYVSSAVNADQWVTGSQGVWVDHRRTSTGGSHVADQTVVIAGHHVAAESVMANTAEYTDGLRFYVRNGYDRRGHPVAFLSWWALKHENADDFEYDATYAGSYAWDYDATSATPSSLGNNSVDTLSSSLQPDVGVNSPLYIGWYDNSDATRGGLLAPDGSTMRGAGDVLVWLLSYSSIPVDRGRFAAAAPLLNVFKLDFTIDSRVTPWEFIQSNLLPILPVTIVSGPNGLYPIVWRYDATRRDSVCHISTETDPRVERASNVQTDRSKIVNDFTLKYALSIRTGNYQASARLMAYADDAAEADEITAGVISLYCRISQERYRRPDGSALVSEEEIESSCIYDDQTALAVLGWRSRAYAFARRRVSYLLPEDGYGHLERGQVVTVTDADLHWEEAVALVESIESNGSPYLTISLLLIEDPVRDLRLVS